MTEFRNKNDVKDLIGLPECYFQIAKKYNPDLAYLKDMEFQNLYRLNPRDAFRQGLNQIYSLFSSTNDNLKIYKVDVNSQFSHIMTCLKIPIGDYEVH